MSLKVSCPKCTKELNSPDELLGHFVACPSCGHKFQVSGVAGNTASVAHVPPSASQSSMNLPPPPPSGGANPSTANLERLSLAPLPSKPNTPAAKAASPNTATHPPAPPALQESTPAAPPVNANNSSVASPVPHPPGQQVATFKGAPPAPQPATNVPAKKTREVKKAKFVASGAVATKINLGEDGQLPKLVVADIKETAEADDAESSSSPLLMIAVLIFSVLVSVVMLVAPDSSVEAESTSKQESMAQLEQYYIGAGPDLQPYQLRLRQGLQALRRGDDTMARQAFRDVLRMMRAESREKTGLTAPEWANVEAPPNDADLEKHLNVLLADD